ncbi:MAG: secretin N-terminal domain-containing protein [Gallionella sp.]
MIRNLLAGLLMLLLIGCAAQQAFQNGVRQFDAGKVEEGLMQMSQAYKLDPSNSEYRVQYFKRREAIIFQWLALANAAKDKAAWAEARIYYERILKIDPDNFRAKTGLSTLATDEKHAQLLDEAKLQLENNDVAGAAHKVRLVLSETPSQPIALALRKTIESRKALASQSGVIIKSKLTRPITIEFKDAPILAVFDSISKISGINILFDKDVRPDLRANLLVRDARIEDVIRFILVTNQLEQRVLNANTLFIYPSTAQKLKDFQELQVRNFYLTNASAKDVAAMLKGMLKSRDLYVDTKLNLIVMRDTPDAILVAERLIAAQDIAEPEVMLEVEVLEVGTNLLDTIGVQYPSQMSLSVVGAAGTPGALMLPELINRNAGLVRVSLSDPAFTINFLHQNGDTNLLANPKIRVKNHEKANIHIGDKVPVITNTTTATGLISQSVSYLDVGLKLDVEPTVYLDNDVGIKVVLEVSNIAKQIQNTNGSLTYQIGSRSATTTLRLKDGETQMLAGLINREDRKTANSIPVLGQIPLLGRLFSSNSDVAAKTEVVLLITPHVVRNIVHPDSPVEEFSSGTDASISLARMEINPADSPSGQKSGEAAAIASDVADATNQELAPLAPALGNVKLSLNVPTQVRANAPFVVSVNLIAEGVQNVTLMLSFDPAKLKVVSVTEGDFLKKSDGKTQFLQQTQDKLGRINLSVIRQGSVGGEGSLANVTFQPIVNVTSNTQVRVDAVNFSDAEGGVLPVNDLPVAAIEITP